MVLVTKKLFIVCCLFALALMKISHKNLPFTLKPTKSTPKCRDVLFQTSFSKSQRHFKIGPMTRVRETVIGTFRPVLSFPIVLTPLKSYFWKADNWFGQRKDWTITRRSPISKIKIYYARKKLLTTKTQNYSYWHLFYSYWHLGRQLLAHGNKLKKQTKNQQKINKKQHKSLF